MIQQVIRELEQFEENTEGSGTSFTSMLQDTADFKRCLPHLITQLNEVAAYIEELEQHIGVKGA